jgi:predicted dienelactone hydrolase
MNTLSKRLALLVGLLVIAGPVLAFQAGWKQISVAGPTSDSPATVVALYYPTQAPVRAVPMGPFTPVVAMAGAPESTVKGLIVLSHGTGGSELGHSSLAEALARSGYLVAALRHPGDNWQDASLLRDHPDRYFYERPRQVSRVIDAILLDPQWNSRIARDAQGPRIGAVGHSAGGYTVLALAGGQPDLMRIARHCAAERSEDPIFCRTGRPAPAAAPAASSPAAGPALRDARVRAVVALAPVGAVFNASSLAGLGIPVAVYGAENDRWLVPRFHAEWIAQNLPGVAFQRVPNAWHFAFMDPPGMPIPSEDGDVGADPPGFDRRAFLDRLGHELPDFFDKAFR